jgi:hypothetical protein
MTRSVEIVHLMVAMGNTIIVITRQGNVFGCELDPTLGVQSVVRVFGFNGGAPQKIGVNAQDKFMVAMRNTLIVITDAGDVFGADVDVAGGQHWPNISD